MSNESADSVSLELGYSRSLAALLAAIHGGALAIAVAMPMPLALRATAAVLIVWSLHHGFSRHVRRHSPRAVTGISLDATDVCAVRFGREPAWVSVSMIGRSVHPWVTIIAVRRPGARLAIGVVIAGDAVGAEAFRRFRVRLRLQPAPA